MNTTNKRPILVTGLHRSGSTWVGKMLALDPAVGYIHEPFNLYHNPGICRAEFSYWFPYINDQNEDKYIQDISDMLQFRHSPIREFKEVKSLFDGLLLVKNTLRYSYYKISSKRPLVKDPIAFFSAEWLANRFNMEVVVLIRHPAAFASSLKTAEWDHPFDHFLKQPLLMQEVLSSFQSEIEDYAQTNKNLVDQAILLWNMFHATILQMQKENSHWIYIKHETLSADPQKEYGNLYNVLGLNYDRKIEKEIEKYSSTTPRGDSISSIRRVSKANIKSWKTKLTQEEITRVKERTQYIAKEFYTEDDW